MSRQEAVEIIDDIWRDLQETYVRLQESRASLSPDLQADMNKYVAVRMAGFLEQLCFHSISGRVAEVTSGSLQAFVNSWFYKSPNLNSSQFVALMDRFGDPIKSDAREFLDDSFRRETLNSLLLLRNSVAHGKQYPGSSRELSHYMDFTTDMYRWFESRFLADGEL